MTTVYAIIENGVVVNTAIADGPWPFEGQQAVPVPDDTPVSIGWLYADGQFSEPS